MGVVLADGNGNPPAFRPFDKLRDRRLKDLPPKFVELVETNPDVTSAFAPHPSLLTVRILFYVIL